MSAINEYTHPMLTFSLRATSRTVRSTFVSPDGRKKKRITGVVTYNPSRCLKFAQTPRSRVRCVTVLRRQRNRRDGPTIERVSSIELPKSVATEGQPALGISRFLDSTCCTYGHSNVAGPLHHRHLLRPAHPAFPRLRRVGSISLHTCTLPPIDAAPNHWPSGENSTSRNNDPSL